MATTQRTVLNVCDPTDDGTIMVRFALQYVDADLVTSSKWQRCSILPGVDPANVIAAVNADIAQKQKGGWPAISGDDADKIRASCAAEHTPDVIAAYRAAQIR